MTQGFQVSRAEAEALLGQLPPARGSRRPRRLRVQVWLDDGEPRPERDRGLADRRLARARGLGPDGHRYRGPPEPQADPHGRRLGRAPAAQGLPDRRRARPLLGARSNGGRSRGARGNAIYEGTRIPHPIPTVLRVSDELLATGDVLTDQLRPEPPVDPRRAAADRRPRRRGGRRARGRDRLPPHRLREEHGAEDLVEGDHLPAADRLPLLPEQRARLRARDREAARARDPRRRRPGCAPASAS